MSDPPQPPAGTPDGWEGLAFGAPEQSSPLRRRLALALLAAGVLVLAGVELGPVLSGGSAEAPAPVLDRTLAPQPTAQPRSPVAGRPPSAPTLRPTGLGVDPTFDRFARDCYGGVMHACDVLYAVSATGSRYEAYADTCAGRQPRGTDVYCTQTFPGAVRGR